MTARANRADFRMVFLYESLFVAWHSINWKRANRNMRRLQRQSVHAQEKAKKRKVHALQFTLARPFSARCLAVHRVIRNSGKRTPGVDGQLLNTPEKKAQAVANINTEDYRPEPLMRAFIPKGISRTTAVWLGPFSLVALMTHALIKTEASPTRQEVWYKKERLTFADAIAMVRCCLWSSCHFSTSVK